MIDEGCHCSWEDFRRNYFSLLNQYKAVKDHSGPSGNSNPVYIHQSSKPIDVRGKHTMCYYKYYNLCFFLIFCSKNRMWLAKVSLWDRVNRCVCPDRLKGNWYGHWWLHRVSTPLKTKYFQEYSLAHMSYLHVWSALLSLCCGWPSKAPVLERAHSSLKTS